MANHDRNIQITSLDEDIYFKMMPDLEGTHVLDLGCGDGRHCNYAVEQGASHVVGVDLSEKMLTLALEQPHADKIRFLQGSIDQLDELNFEAHEFDIVISSLALHYLPDFEDVVEAVKHILTINGTFLFMIEHPIYTAHGSQDWVYDAENNRIHWPVDMYHREGERQQSDGVIKYHRTLSHYLSVLIEENFVIKGINESLSAERNRDDDPDIKDELRRPKHLIISARRK
ncbi:class I SAM-dependent methyltransferase [Macrococcus hajekii]|uniref:Class I SAM-dependent methyltransferase n=1 Tax=Macrococcus hajekii TaxID=198482 RepID=A0A4R6BHU8_9STAP|nr:class I SAM-dependent methyltransferase [Macrococcus hajekii]TDM01177.1 class I SAM-dependent methyltransferase [Macrococcus hajekii]GGB11924.1 SAM-dependent methyltransferase [Macrococcus hajekii]